jgi:hypothetical protein
MLRRGGSLEVVVPFAEYESKFSDRGDKEEYRRLLRRATAVEVLNRHGSDEEAYLAAGKRLVDLSDLVIAVWNGRPAAGLGGTGDIAVYTMRQRKRGIHINPLSKEVKELCE